VRILFVSQEVPPETGWGGIGTYVDVLSEALAASGHDVHVLSVVDRQQVSVTKRGSVTVHRYPLPPLRGSWRLPPESFKRTWLPLTVARLIPALGIDPTTIECPEWMAEGLALALRGRLPLVIRLHSSARQLFPYTGQGTRLAGLDGWVAARLEELSARRANVVISTRSNLDEVAESLGLEDRALHAIPYPVRLPDAAPLARNGAPRVAFVGRLEPRKAPEVVLRAAPKVLAALPDARFVFVGRDVMEDGAPSSTSWLRAEADRLGIAHAVELTGGLDRTGVEAQLRAATVCAFPSRWESFGNVVAEASAIGRPVVASEIPPFRELVADGVNGRIAPLDEPEVWADLLIELLRDRELAADMGRAGTERIAGISAPARVAELTLAAHEHAIERWRHGERAGRT
jgi:glycogen synthase